MNIYDLPGFCDNRGEEIDIRNCLEIQSIIKGGHDLMKIIMIMDYIMFKEKNCKSIIKLL
jgi:hypothetical protein